MNILITVATIQEINPFINALALNQKTKNKLFNGRFKKYNITILITGIGVVSTTYNLTKEILRTKYDLAFNVGIAGSFKKDIAIGDVVNVMEDRFSEFGVEDGDKFILFNELKKENIDISDAAVGTYFIKIIKGQDVSIKALIVK